jgi:DNA-binding NtrC family response regulator
MKKILFINNEKDVQERVKEILDKREDYSLHVATSVAEANRILQEGGVDFVLFDVDVAMDEGVNCLLDMKAKYPDLPIVATTPIRRKDEIQPGGSV